MSPKNAAVLVLVLASAGVGAWQVLRSKPAPDIQFTDVDGNPHSFIDYRNSSQPVLATFWINNCGYSAITMQLLSKLRGEYPAESLAILGFYLNPSDPHTLKESAAAQHYSMTIVATRANSGPGLDRELAEAFDVHTTGDIVVIDGRGKIRKMIRAARTPEELEKQVRAALERIGLPAASGK